MRLIRVFYEPEKVFAEIKDAQKGVWMLPLIATLLISFLTTFTFLSMIGLETITRNQLEASPRVTQSLGQERIDQMAREAGASTARKVVTYATAVAASAISMLLVAAILFGLAQMMDAGTTYGKVLAVCCYSFFAYGLVTGIMSIAIIAATSDYSGLDLGSLIKTNPAIFLDKSTTSRPLYSLLSSLDLLSFWLIFLLGLGLSKVGPKLKLSRALTLVIIPWVVWVLGRAGLAALF